MAAEAPGRLTARAFGGYPGYEGPRYKGFTTESLYVPMRDGTRIAVELHLPKGLPSDARLPTVIRVTRYWRAVSLRWPANLLDRDPFATFFTKHGYAVVQADTRGTGASFGTWVISYAPQEIQDVGYDLVDWITRQPWSNGNVGAQGISYRGNVAARMPIANHSALKAVVPRSYEFDEYLDQPFAGGLCNRDFIDLWNQANRALDSNDVATVLKLDETGLVGRLALRGVKPVDEDRDGSLLRAAVTEHEGNGDVLALAHSVTYRDDVPTGYDMTIDDISLHTHRADVERSGAAYYLWGSWLDAGTANGVLHQFFTFKNPHRAVIGAWTHGARADADLFKPPKSPVVPSEKDQFLDCLRFLDHYLRDTDTGIMSERLLHYYTSGEQRWKTTEVWPPAGTTMQRLYLAEDQGLSDHAPHVAEGADRYTVDFAATTGKQNRWYTQLGRAVRYDKRAEQLQRTLSYRSAPLDCDTEITGHPVVSLQLRSTHTDGAVFVYLDVEAPDGTVTYLTEGLLRLLHRKLATRPALHTTFGPHHTFTRADGALMVPGEVAEVMFALFPTSVLVPSGYRLLVSIAGHDRDNFSRCPAEGDPVLTLERNAAHASFIELPIAARA